MRPRLSLEAQAVLLAAAGAALGGLTTLLLRAWTGQTILAAVLAAAIVAPLVVWGARRWMGPLTRLVRSVSDGIGSLKDGDYSVSIAASRRDELGELVRHYNEVGDRLRRERQDLLQRELLLDTVIQTTPVALLLEDSRGRVIYSNTVARQMFGDGRKLEGLTLGGLVDAAPAALQDAVRSGRDTLFSLEAAGGEPEVMHLAQRRFVLNGREHRLYLFKRLTRELTRQEVATWKKVIRVISHELNNSLAPISSLAHSGRIVAGDPDPARLESIFGTIEERAAHLKTFLDGYVSFAKLPAPRLQRVEWVPFMETLRTAASFRAPALLPRSPGYFDPAQVEQLVINLIKNAHEAGSSAGDIELRIDDDGRMVRLQVLDRGSGMTEQVLSNALLPFYSTKRSGTGLGLSLCREIAEAHGGRLSLGNRADGGLAVSVWLPRGPATD